MNAAELLRAAIEQRNADLSSSIAANPQASIVALVRAIDHLPLPTTSGKALDPLTGIPVPGLCASRALQIALGAGLGNDPCRPGADAWALPLLDQCRQLAAAELALAQADTGFLRLQVGPDGAIEARIARRSAPVRWRERADDAFWRAWRESTMPLPDAPPKARATARVDRMAHPFDFAPGTRIAGVEIDLARAVLANLVLWADNHLNGTIDRDGLIAMLVAETGASPDGVAQAVDVLTLDRDNASWHATVPGIAGPPLIGVGESGVIVSRRGLHHDPFRFLTRELRRRDRESYHAAAASREQGFRADLNGLFGHQRFVTTPRRIELRREHGSVRTDIDAAVFDRKTGTLAIFELKSHEPYARSTAELERVRENVRAAGRQVAAMLDWINRHGADEVLNRIDRRTAKGFRVQKVRPFVLGRYLLDGENLDRRAVWATWPQLLRALDGQPLETLGSNPIAILATRLERADPDLSPGNLPGPVRIALEDISIEILPPR